MDAMYAPKPIHLVLSLPVLVAAMSLACLWPFNFTPSNKVQWLPQEGGVSFTGRGCIVGKGEFPPLSRLSSDGSLTVEVAVRPAKLGNRGLPHVLTFHPDEGPSPLMIGAWRNSLIARLGRAGAAGRRPFREIGCRNAFTPEQTVIVTVAAGPAGTALYLDGRVQDSFPGASLEGRPDSLGTLLLGISPTGSGEWNGDILGLRIYNRFLTGTETLLSCASAGTGAALPRELQAATVAAYDFSEGSGSVVRDGSGWGRDLIIPEACQPLDRVILELPTETQRRRWSFAGDLVLNVLGFIPLAVLSAWTLTLFPRIHPGCRARLVVLASTLLSLSFEIIQAYLPSRSSSLTDLFTNVLGAAIGVVLFHALAATGRLSTPAGYRPANP